MARAIDGSKRKNHRKKILKLAKGYWGRRSTNYKTAKDAVAKSLSYAYRDRKAKKREFRRLWIARINAAARNNGMSYNRFMNGLKNAGVDINRKVLADLAINDGMAFGQLVTLAKDNAKA